MEPHLFWNLTSTLHISIFVASNTRTLWKDNNSEWVVSAMLPLGYSFRFLASIFQNIAIFLAPSLSLSGNLLVSCLPSNYGNEFSLHSPLLSHFPRIFCYFMCTFFVFIFFVNTRDFCRKFRRIQRALWSSSFHCILAACFGG